MKKIERLTPEQEAELPRFRQEYMDIACGGARADREALHSAMTDAYGMIGKKSPALFIFDSPAACMLAIKIFQMGGDPKFKLGDQLRDQLGGQLRGQLWGQLWGQLGDQLRDQLWGQLRGQKIWNPNFLWGSQDLYWIAWGKFAERIGVKLNPETSRKLDIMDRIGRQCEWWWPFGNVVFASQRPAAVHWDDARRLHCETGPAVRYADGYSLHAWHGLRVPAHWIEDRANLDPNEVIKHENVELRAAGAAIAGWPKMLSVLKAKVIDDSGSPDIGQLIELKLPGLREPGRFLKAECPRNGIIVEGVPPVSDIDGLPIKTALHAQAWRIGDALSEYSHPPMRT